MRKLIMFLLMALSLNGLCQDPNFPVWTAAEVSKANTAAGISELSNMEREIIYLMNLARMDGAKFWNTYLSKHLGNRSNSYITSLQRDLQSVKNLPMLYPDAGLCKAAKYHAGDMARNNFFAHNSYDGTGCFQRLKRYYASGTAAENISAGMKTPIAVVAQLLVDENTPSLGHRKNILNRTYNAVGVACGKHSSYQCCCVQDFGDRVLNKMNGGGNVSPDNDGKGGNDGKTIVRPDNDEKGGGKTIVRPDNGGKTGPRFPDVRNIKSDSRWKWDDELEAYYFETAKYIFIYEPNDKDRLYYNNDTEEMFFWDKDSNEWQLLEDDDDDDDDW